MKSFALVNVRDEKKVKEYKKSPSFKQSEILPCYSEGYICFSSRKDYSFEELMKMFLQGDEDERIGAISIIAERFPHDLYDFIRDNNHYIPSQQVKFLVESVASSYLPLVLSANELTTYIFDEDYSDDIWVKILTALQSRL